jgi:hypothetical protein
VERSDTHHRIRDRDGFASLYPSYIMPRAVIPGRAEPGMHGRNGEAGQQNRHRNLSA